VTTTRDVVVVGGGVNGLTCAALLARAGLAPLVLEASDKTGGGARTDEIAPGFHVPTLAHATGPLRADVIERLDLTQHGLQFVSGEVAVAALAPGERPLLIYENPTRTAEALRAFSPGDATAWPSFVSSIAAFGRVLGRLFRTTPPSIDDPSGRDLLALLHVLRAFRALGRAEAYRLLRWAPMAVADLVGECFESERLRAAVAADGIFGTRLGPWSAGSGMVLLLRAANEAIAPPRSWFVRGGPGALALALERAIRTRGGEIRTGARVARILVEHGRACGVVLDDGTAIAARAVVSGVDPKRTLLDLCDPIELPPEIAWRMHHYRCEGTVAKVNLALSTLPRFEGLSADALAGRIRIAPDVDYLERAFDHSKYGRFSPHPYIEATVPTVLDPGLAPKGAHVLSAYVQFAPYTLRDGGWESQREALGRSVIDAIERCAPGLRASIVAEQILTPLDLERTYGFTGGHIFHGELTLDQLFTMRPVLGWARYRTPIAQLFLCGSGAHPGTGLTGGSGANAAREVIRALR
jgi:phytoene dehydrogenase-like protein